MQNLLYIGGGFAAGWVLGKLLFGDGTIRQNASGRGKEPTIEELVNAQLFDESLEPIQRIKATKLAFVKKASLWSTIEPGEFLLMYGELPIGVIVQDTKGRFRGYVGNKKLLLADKTTRKNAIGAVYAASMLFRYLSTQRDYSDVTVRSRLHYAEVHTVSVWRPRLMTANDIADALNIPLPLIIEVGQKLAEKNWIFGVAGKVRIEPTLRQEKVLVPGMTPLSDDPAMRERQEKELARARRQRRRGRKEKIEHKRRLVVSSPDVAALRKSPVLTKEEKRSLPRAKSVLRYSFALYGPDGSVGMYEAGSKKVQTLLEGDWTEDERKKLQKRFEKREQEAKRAEEEELEALRTGVQTTLTTPRAYHETYEEAIRKLLTSPEEEPSETFFEGKRLEGLDWLSRQRDQQHRARKVDATMKRVEGLRAQLKAATKRKEAAIEKGDGNQALQAVAQEMEIRSKLDAMLKKLEQAQKALHEKHEK
ncbi:MAG: hypothetical protein ACYS7Y_16625 [Planctomycetota bacterium]|jgi:hypothetical protein